VIRGMLQRATEGKVAGVGGTKSAGRGRDKEHVTRKTCLRFGTHNGMVIRHISGYMGNFTGGKNKAIRGLKETFELRS